MRRIAAGGKIAEPDAVGSRMHGERQAVPLAGFVNRIELALSVGCRRAGIRHDLDQMRVSGQPFDFPDRAGYVLRGYADRPFEDAVVVVGPEPGFAKPIVKGVGQHGGVGGIRNRVGKRALDNDNMIHAVLVISCLRRKSGSEAGGSPEGGLESVRIT